MRARRSWLAAAGLAIVLGAGLAAPAWGQTAEEWFRRGREATSSDDQIRYYSEFLRLRPNDYVGYNNRCIAYRDKKLYDLAMADCNRSIQLKSDYALAYINRGNIYLDRQQIDQSIADYTKAIQLKSDSALAYRNRGIAYEDKQQLDLAIADYSKAVQFDPSDAHSYWRRGISYDIKNMPDLALADIAKAIQLRPSESTYYNSRAVVQGRKGLYDLAIADYTKAIQLRPGFTLAHRNRGLMYVKKKMFDLAKGDYMKAAQLAPEDAAANNSLAWFLATCPGPASCRDGQRAVEHAIKAVGLSYSPWHMDTLAAAYAEAGRFDDAVRTGEQALSMLRQQKGSTERIAAYEKRLALYKQKKPYRETE